MKPRNRVARGGVGFGNSKAQGRKARCAGKIGQQQAVRPQGAPHQQKSTGQVADRVERARRDDQVKTGVADIQPVLVARVNFAPDPARAKAIDEQRLRTDDERPGKGPFHAVEPVEQIGCHRLDEKTAARGTVAPHPARVAIKDFGNLSGRGRHLVLVPPSRGADNSLRGDCQNSGPTADRFHVAATLSGLCRDCRE